MIEIVVGPFTHHEAVEGFWFKFRILENEVNMLENFLNVT